MILFVYVIQDVLKGIAKREKWDLKDLTTFKLDAKKFKFGTLRKYEFRVQIGMTKFVFMIEDEIFQWENLQFHDKNGSDFDSLFKEIVSKATLDVLQTQWSFELYATGNAHLSLTFPVRLSFFYLLLTYIPNFFICR